MDREIQSLNGGPDPLFEFSDFQLFEQTNYDLAITVIPGTQLKVKLSYNALMYQREVILNIGKHFTTIFKNICKNPQRKINGIEILSDEEKRRLLVDFNDTAVDYPRDQTVYHLFEEQVAKTPDDIAVIYEDQKVTYGELNRKANLLARICKERGVKRDSIVGIMAERSLGLMVGIIAPS